MVRGRRCAIIRKYEDGGFLDGGEVRESEINLRKRVLEDTSPSGMLFGS